MIKLSAPEIGAPEIAAVTRVLRSGWLVQGPEVARFEAAVARLAGVSHAVAVNSGTAALHLALLALGVKKGDEVLVPDFTFPATANAVRLCGAEPVTVDVSPSTYNISLTAAAKAVTRRTKGIIPVHLFGLPADMDAARRLARAKGLWVLEDAACALGAKFQGRPCGGLGDVGIFSFHPRKLVTTGEGGMIVTGNARLAERARHLRNHGQAAPGKFVEAGYNYRMTDFQAALGSAQLRRLPETLRKHRTVAGWYRERLAGLEGISLPLEPAGARSSWQAFVIRLARRAARDRALRELNKRGIEAAIGTYALSLQPAYARTARACPESRRLCGETLALPLHAGISELDVIRIFKALQQ